MPPEALCVAYADRSLSMRLREPTRKAARQIKRFMNFLYNKRCTPVKLHVTDAHFFRHDGRVFPLAGVRAEEDPNGRGHCGRSPLLGRLYRKNILMALSFQSAKG